jgi:hypothetical protein
MMNKFRFKFIHAVLFAAFAVTASAGTLTLFCTATPMAALTPTSQTSSGTLTCPQFNPALGNLLNYTIRALGEGVGPYAGISGFVTVQNLLSVDIVGPGGFDGPPVNIAYTGLPGVGSFGGFRPVRLSGPTNLPANGGTQTLNVSPLDPASIIAITTFARTDSLGSYVGTGTFNASILASFPFPLTSPGVLAYTDFSIVPVGGISVVYNYDPIPEPSAFALAAGGIGLLAFARRNHRQRRSR